MAALQRVFGIVGICPVVIVEREGFEELSSHVMSYVREMYGGQKKTFKVHTRRAHKGFPMESMEINAELGGRILEMCIRDSNNTTPQQDTGSAAESTQKPQPATSAGNSTDSKKEKKTVVSAQLKKDIENLSLIHI